MENTLCKIEIAGNEYEIVYTKTKDIYNVFAKYSTGFYCVGYYNNLDMDILSQDIILCITQSI